MVRVEELFLEDFQVLVVQVKLQLESAVGNPATLSEQLQYLIEHGIEVHVLDPGEKPLTLPLSPRERGKERAQKKWLVQIKFSLTTNH
jgi:hypothetical protein